ncbi:peroxisomal membrane protein mpv17 [Gigaspora margarita]|uniref:Peroxisomal membrane protein mpv17 n=1 Tax=Gigaspora margarita TaxID=4874 RepID=A0A8H4ANN6_GIGMA|nr:peroxisomal membrane protein mpv17 [Gigaspora margarita]
MATKISDKCLPTRSNSANQASSPLFELMNMPSRLVLEKVYLNGLHALRHFEIRNISQNTILIKLRSNLGSQIAFQLTNENLPELRPSSPIQKEINGSSTSTSPYISPVPENDILLSTKPEDPLTDITTNTVAAAAAGTFGDNVNGHQFNQLFNYVNHIGEVEIAPGCSQKVILSFLPDRHYKNRRSTADSSMTTDDISENETFDFFEVNGLLFFFAYIIDKPNDNDVNTHSLAPSIMEVDIGKDSEYIQFSSSDNKLSKYDIENVPYRDIETISGTSRADHQVTVKFRSTVCRSVLWTDVGETGINFDDCVIGGVYFKDFTIWNRSEIELYWLLNTVDLSSKREDWLKFLDYDTGELLDTKPIPSYSHRRIRITFRPTEIGEFNYDLQLENANDPTNVLQSRIHAVVRSVLREESLVISSGNVLDFGDCCAGVWSKQQLVLKNVGGKPLEVHFVSENADVSFHLITNEMIKYDNMNTRAHIEDLEDMAPLHQKFNESNVSSSTPMVNNVNSSSISEISVPGSEVSSRSMSPIAPAHESDGLISPENISVVSEPSSETASRSASRHRTNITEDSDLESSLSENTSGRSFLISDSFRKSIGDIDGFAQIEEVYLKPGKERTVQVSYRPEKDSSATDLNAILLTRKTFRITVQYAPINASSIGLGTGGQGRKIIQCKARSCTSFIEVSPKEVNFGDTDVGTLKSMPILITNLSELTARVELRFDSKVLYCTRKEIIIPPKLSTEVKLDMYPRKINVDYRKQITVVNLQNRDNDQIIEVRSTNIDKNRVTFHSLFYRTLTSNGSNFIDFGYTVLNSPSIRTFTIDNISKKKLVLEITSSLAEEIVMYQKRKKTDDLSNQGDIIMTDLTNSDNNFGGSEEIDLEKIEKISRSICERRCPLTTDSAGTNMNRSNLSAVNAAIQTEEAHSSISNKRLIPNTSDASLTDVTTHNTDYLDLAGSTSIDLRRSPRRRQQKAQIGKAAVIGVSPAIERIKESYSVPIAASGSGSANSTNIASANFDKSNSDIGDGNIGDESFVNKLDHDSESASLILSKRCYAKNKAVDKCTFSNMPIDSLIATLEANDNTTPPLFPKPSVEEAYVRRQIGLMQELHNRIRDHQIVPIEMVEIPPSGETQIVVIFKPKQALRPNVQGLPKKCDAKVFIRLVDFDRDIQQPQFDGLLHGNQDQIPVRELMVNATLCRSYMILGQKNINFGIIDKGDRRNKTILIQNRSEVPLLYNIQKSGSIASRDVGFGLGRLGVVRGYGNKEVEFTFKPRFSGQFYEKFTIENIQDHDNNQMLSVKADIRKPFNFLIQPTNIDFGACLINENAPIVHSITVSNNNKQSRTIEVRIDPRDLKFNSCVGELNFILQEESGILSKETEEKIEELEQKVKIARRKGYTSKVEQIEKQLETLRRGKLGFENSKNANELVNEIAADYVNDMVSKEEKLSCASDEQQTISEETFLGSLTNERPSENNFTQGKQPSHAEKVADYPAKRVLSPNPSNGKDTKYKKTSTSIIFSIEPQTTKTVTIYFRAMATNMLSNLPFEQITGKVYVHEHKNTDVVKTISFRAIIYYEYSSYLRALNDASNNEHRSESEFLTIVTDKSEQIVKERTDSYANPPENKEHLSENLSLDPPILNIGKLEVNQSHNYYFKLSNRGDHLLEYEIIVPENECSFFRIDEKFGKLSARETRRIDFSVIATDVGRQKHSLTVRNCETQAQCSFTLHGYIHYAQYLSFPSLGDDGDELNLGYCYVDPGRKYSQVTPLIVENITDEDVFITCQSNLSFQVAVFLDENCERGQIVETLLRKKTVMTVWVALQPNLLSGIPATSRRNNGNTGNSGNTSIGASIVDRNAIANGECRVLIGGIKFSVQVKEADELQVVNSDTGAVDMKPKELFTIITQIVKFTSLIGRSILSVSDSLVNLGSTTVVGDTFYGSFTVRNMSSRLPLDYVVECSSGNIILDRSGGTLEGWECKYDSYESSSRNIISSDIKEITCKNDINDKSSALINFRVTSCKYGLFCDKIIVTNKNNADQVVEVEVRLFVDPNTLSFLTEEDNGNVKDTENLPMISWENVFISVNNVESSLTAESEVKEGVKEELQAFIQKERQAISIPLYEQSAEICNKSSTHIMQILPLSDLNVVIRWESFENIKADQIQNDRIQHNHSPFKICGPLFELKPGDKARVYLSCPQPDSLTQEELHMVSNGKNVSVQGVFFFIDEIQDLVVKLVDICATFCVSKGELSTPIVDLGRIGYSNSWSDVKFQFSVRNISDIPLNYELEIPDYIEMDDNLNSANQVIDLKHTVEPRADQIITAILKPRLIPDFTADERIFIVNVLNMYNPSNVLTLKVKSVLTLFELKFDRLTQGELVMPPLYHPIPSSDAPCDAWFTILNVSDKDIRFEIGVELKPDVSQFVKVEVLSRYSNSPLVGVVSISGNGSIEVRVRIYPIEERRIPRELSYLTDDDGIIFGNLWVATKQIDNIDQKVAENIPIRGVIAESVMFSTSPQRILFKTTWSSDGEITDEEHSESQSISIHKQKISSRLSEEPLDISDSEDAPVQNDSIIIINNSDKIPLSFKVQIEGPMEFSAKDIINITPMSENGCGTVEAGQKLSLGVDLVNSAVAVSEDIKIHVLDLLSLCGQKRTIFVSIESDTREHRSKTKRIPRSEDLSDSVTSETVDHKPLAPSLEGRLTYQESSSDLPFITLRGCKRIGEATDSGDRYELNLGQQDLGSPTIVKKLTLENLTSQQISYRLKTVFENDKNWLNINRIDGTLEASVDAHTITLSFSTNARNIYSTYLIIENLNNPSDIKTIRVMMEVVARQNLRRGINMPLPNNHVFDIYVNGIDISHTWIEMLNLFYGAEYSARSMVIYNRETVPLEFTFKTNLDYDDPTEIVFSTSRISAKLFKTLTVEPESNVRVYIRFRPLPSREIQKSLDNGLKDPELVEEKIIEIYVNCRLVKDYQQTVILKAECKIPSLRVDYEDSALTGKICRQDTNCNEEEFTVQFEQEFREIMISNLFDTPLEYEIVNDTIYFSLDISHSNKGVAPKSDHRIIVRPNLKTLLKNAESIRREKYIQEYVTVYNRNRPSENYWIPLRISFGYFTDFQLASGYKASYAFGVLEYRTVHFLNNFNRNSHNFSLPDTCNDEDFKKMMRDIEFQYYYIVDQLVYYSTIKTGENWFQLASLLFGIVLRNQIFQDYGPAYLKKPNDETDKIKKLWPPHLAKWISPLNYFISFFPYQNPMLETLKDLHKNLIVLPAFTN